MEKVIVKPIGDEIHLDGRIYDARTIYDRAFLGNRLTDCCGSFATYGDGGLYCKKCYQEVEIGEGDGVDNISNSTMSVTKVKWNINKKTNKVTSCEITRETDDEFHARLVALGAKFVQLGGAK